MSSPMGTGREVKAQLGCIGTRTLVRLRLRSVCWYLRNVLMPKQCKGRDLIDDSLSSEHSQECKST